jgi:hypothetical protein
MVRGHDKNQRQLSPFMVPHIELDHPNINPEVSRCLLDLIYNYIRHCRLEQSTSQVEDIQAGACALMRSFDFNRDLQYDPDVYMYQLQVCTLSLHSSE